MQRPNRVRSLAIAIAVVLIAALCAAPTSIAARSHGPRHAGVGRSTSGNWSGYSATGGGATHVIGSWTQPRVQKCAAGETSWSSPWVGIDGDTSNTVEQIGTDSDCQNGVPYYYAWYEMYPKQLVKIAIPVSPGDNFTGEVTYTSSGTFLLTLTNNTVTSSKPFSTTQTSKKARLASVEWIMEGPTSGTLTNFGTVSFTNASGTINGQTASLGSLSPLDPITMVTNQGIARAIPSSVAAGDTAFSVTWQHP